ncbi:acetate--CoA ligase family protein [Pseudooceanicola sp.]|uniref:acetate--CoA ligase family protein n=1 Tax=Pseudooceanicola sp. TaxID=1914328 RepID=UPI004058EA0E
MANSNANQPGDGRPSRAEALDVLFNPRSIAVVGASRTKGKLGQAVLALLKKNGYGGKIIPVNPSGGEIEGLQAVRSLDEIEGAVDVVVLATPVGIALDALEACKALDVKMVVGVTSGFSEAGDDGHENEARLRRIMHDAPFYLIGPNCEGVVKPSADLQLTFSPMFDGLRPGPVAMISQSGALAGLMALRLGERGVGINAIVSSGNETDLTAADLLDYLGNDPETRVVLCYVEELREGRRFVEAARRLTDAGKHVVAVKGGRSRAGSRAVQSHTGAMAGDDRVISAIFRETGVIRARESVAAVDAVTALAAGRKPAGKRVGIISVTGGLGVEMTDLAESAGFEVPVLAQTTQTALSQYVPFYGSVTNPVDLTGVVLANPTYVGRCLEAVAADPGVDIAIAIVTFVPDQLFIEALAEAYEKTDKPVLIIWTGSARSDASDEAFRERAVPVYDSPARAASGLAALMAMQGEVA